MHFCSFLVNFPSVPQSSFPSTPTSCSTPTNSAVPERSGTIEDSELMGDDIDSLLDCVSTEPETAEVNSKCCVFFSFQNSGLTFVADDGRWCLNNISAQMFHLSENQTRFTSCFEQLTQHREFCLPFTSFKAKYGESLMRSEWNATILRN